MFENFCEKLAKLVVHHSIKVKKGNRIIVMGLSLAKNLFLALQTEVLKAGGHPILFPQLEGANELYYKHASDEQLGYYDDIYLTLAREINGLIRIACDNNTKKFSLVDTRKIGIVEAVAKKLEMQRIISQRQAKGEVNWVVIPYPCNSYAQEANMDLYSYSEFVEKALLLDKENPTQEWEQIHRKQDEIVEYLNNVKEIHVLGEDTDLTLSVEGRTWINCSGQNNLPDGEVYTGPIERSVNGCIRFTFPGIYKGREIENIYLEFEKGKVVNAMAEKGQELLQEILKIRNANKMGEFAIGTNYGIERFTKSMLFDEKIGGTLHCALGLGMPESGSKNISTIHWDILKDMKVSGSKIIADGVVIYEEGKWKI